MNKNISTYFQNIKYITLIIYISFILLPIGILLFNAFSNNNLINALNNPIVTSALFLSLITSLIAITIVIVIGIPVAHIITKSNSRFIKYVDYTIELPIILPPVVVGFAMLMTFGRNGPVGKYLMDFGVSIPFTTIAVILAQIFVAFPFFLRSVRLGLSNINTDFEDIGSSLGLNPLKRFFYINLPLAWKSIINGAALGWARAISEFGATLVFAGNLTGETQTMPLAIISTMESDFELGITLSAILILISTLVLILLARLRHYT
ncbi:MAG: molybdate ABC transporter permease subunit [Chloroflexi bacterium]|jgi:molybdate transport system permease protein|nr:molybdate ABC transporter permease subunit [Chloroflexota bacterium]|tara:strand:+ start:217 stop:1008 length:792 start_codon:yes stop_codon:yes gene_type:complete